MENASKALLMAAGVLIGVAILSLAVFLFVDFGSISRDTHSKIAEQQLVQFNSKFSVYESYKENGKWQNLSSIYDVTTVAGYARENNNYYKESNVYSSDFQIIVKLGNVDLADINKNINFEEDYLNVIDQNTAYKCTIPDNQGYHDNGRIWTIIFSEINQ